MSIRSVIIRGRPSRRALRRDQQTRAAAIQDIGQIRYEGACDCEPRLVAVLSGLSTPDALPLEGSERWTYYQRHSDGEHDVVGVRCGSDSFYPVIAQGDELFVDRGAPARSGDIIVAAHHGQFLCGVYEPGGRVTFAGSSSSILDDSTRIVGVVIGKRVRLGASTGPGAFLQRTDWY